MVDDKRIFLLNHGLCLVFSLLPCALLFYTPYPSFSAIGVHLWTEENEERVFIWNQRPRSGALPSPNMFPKYPPGRHPFSPYFPLGEPDHNDAPSPGAATPAATALPEKLSAGDGAIIEVVRRPRGRQPGSRNKPKPPVVITLEAAAEPAMSPYFLEVPSGSDCIEAVSRFCHRRGISLCVLTGSGTVTDFTIRQPASVTPGATVTCQGRFEILSVSATFLHGTAPFQVPKAFNICFAGPQGQILGGAVVGPLIANGPVFLIAATFNGPTYERLPEVEDDVNSSASGSVSHRRDVQSPPVSGSGDYGGLPQPTAETHGMSTYGCHLGSDALWAPSARLRQPPGLPPHPPY